MGTYVKKGDPKEYRPLVKQTIESDFLNDGFTSVESFLGKKWVENQLNNKPPRKVFLELTKYLNEHTYMCSVAYRKFYRDVFDRLLKVYGKEIVLDIFLEKSHVFGIPETWNYLEI